MFKKIMYALATLATLLLIAPVYAVDNSGGVQKTTSDIKQDRQEAAKRLITLRENVAKLKAKTRAEIAKLKLATPTVETTAEIAKLKAAEKLEIAKLRTEAGLPATKSVKERRLLHKERTARRVERLKMERVHYREMYQERERMETQRRLQEQNNNTNTMPMENMNMNRHK